ncbi:MULTISPECIES: phage regulatory CII family protein [unclassified Rhizobium]|uniref:phage regulatory CII family protein n=1 Tax=unclassified Rhizobium TaxID=2613769 RepID=UPI001ADB9483|nr:MULTISPECIES: phage regulatory CII family protein [unclassified Rhizobium]MBO9099981.1 hypothetical protein [Rhizobium sp. L58/93]QXZ82792.1 hypothetical protein J5287_11950 [Rhizobium sp. K1/93]QXZ89695.1 hypothetical protein J5280_16640 [Rhizobium sp. K15/93]
MRAFSEISYRSLKRICGVAYGLVGGNTLFAHTTRVSVSQLSKYASFKLEDEGTYMPIDVAIDLDLAAQSPMITSQMAELLGYRLEPIGNTGSAGKLSVADAHVVLSEAMDVSQAILKAFEDGRVDALEKKQLRQELCELIRASQLILAKIDEVDA